MKLKPRREIDEKARLLTGSKPYPLELYEEETEPEEGEAGDESSHVSEGPLSRFPSTRHMIPAAFLFALFYVFSVLYSGHRIGDNFWVSGAAVFSHHEYWRVVTALFTHRDIVHLLSNALMFFVFGWVLKAYFGYLAFPTASLLIGIVTNIITVALYDPDIMLIGASGMTYGMAALWIVLYIRFDQERRVPVRIFRAAGFALVMLLPSTIEPDVSYLAHAVGFVTGILSGIALFPFASVREPA